MNESTHRLTDIQGPKDPLRCQSCGRAHDELPLDKPLSRWQEHDHHDRPEHRLIVLCVTCSNRLIKPHPRLYSRLDPNQPWPGCMSLCLDCRHREGVRCTHPDAKANGGKGVTITIAKPIHAMVDGRGYRGPLTIYPNPASACAQKEADIQRAILTAPISVVSDASESPLPAAAGPHPSETSNPKSHGTP